MAEIVKQNHDGITIDFSQYYINGGELLEVSGAPVNINGKSQKNSNTTINLKKKRYGKKRTIK